MSKEIRIVTHGASARDLLLEGVNGLADAVQVTVGPAGQTVIIEDPATEAPYITKDGVTVARAIKYKDKIKNMGAQTVKEASNRTVDTVGDGTTSSTIMARSLIAQGFKAISAKGVDRTELIRGIKETALSAYSNIRESSKPVLTDEDVFNIANISSNGDIEVANLIVEALSTLGHNAVITVEEARGMESSINTTEGLKLDRGYLSPHFITEEKKQIVVLESPYILLYNGGLSVMADMIHILERVAGENRSLLVIAGGVDGEALTTLVINKLRGSVKVAAIQVPGFGIGREDSFADIAAVTGATIVSDDGDVTLARVEERHFGSAGKVMIGKDYTTIVDGNGDKEEIEKLITTVSHYLESAEVHAVPYIEKRLSNLKGGVAVLHVGAATEIEMREKKDRVEDALAATKSAVEEGTVPGGGYQLYKAAETLSKSGANTENASYNQGVSIALEAMRSPALQILKNAELEKKAIPSMKSGLWYNSRTRSKCTLVEEGVIDPAKVVRVSLENAVSVSVTLISVGCTINIDPDVEKF